MIVPLNGEGTVTLSYSPYRGDGEGELWTKDVREQTQAAMI